MFSNAEGAVLIPRIVPDVSVQPLFLIFFCTIQENIRQLMYTMDRYYITPAL